MADTAAPVTGLPRAAPVAGKSAISPIRADFFRSSEVRTHLLA
jgi:hypothetical protein